MEKKRPNCSHFCCLWHPVTAIFNWTTRSLLIFSYLLAAHVRNGSLEETCRAGVYDQCQFEFDCKLFDFLPLVCIVGSLRGICFEHTNQQACDALFCDSVWSGCLIFLHKFTTCLSWSSCNPVDANKTSQVHLRGAQTEGGRTLARDEMRCEGDTGAEMPQSDL